MVEKVAARRVAGSWFNRTLWRRIIDQAFAHYAAAYLFCHRELTSMKRSTFCLALVALSFCSASVVWAEDEYTVQTLDEAAPGDDLAPEVAAALSPTGLKVMKGENRSVCSFWPVAQLKTKADFTPSASMLYPVEMGELIGVIHFKRKAQDFRGQEIEAGTYTVRFALQPEDGNHVGTSDTRDFLVLLKPSDDSAPEKMATGDLFAKSAAAAGTTHPCMLALLSAADTTGELPSVEHDADRELLSVAFSQKTATKPLTMRMVVVGRAAE